MAVVANEPQLRQNMQEFCQEYGIILLPSLQPLPDQTTGNIIDRFVSYCELPLTHIDGTTCISLTRHRRADMVGLLQNEPAMISAKWLRLLDDLKATLLLRGSRHARLSSDWLRQEEDLYTARVQLMTTVDMDDSEHANWLGLLHEEMLKAGFHLRDVPRLFGNLDACKEINKRVRERIAEKSGEDKQEK